MTEKLMQKKPYPMGAHVENGGVRFSFVSESAVCGVLLYDRASGRLREKIPFSEADRIGRVYCRTVELAEPERYTYLFFENDRLVPDERGRIFPGKTVYGKARSAKDMKAGFLTEGFDWKGDSRPQIPYHLLIGYCMHVRGFTKHASSRVKCRGTFAGIVEKLSYLKEIGVTTLELQPAYEFEEAEEREEGFRVVDGEICEAGENRLNYWGYKKGYYYTPKAAYAASGNPSEEFKELVRTLHENRMELIMQFYFPDEVKRSEIPEILRFWVLEYHVDGFHLLGENIPADMLGADDVLADTKLWYYGFDTGAIYGRGKMPAYPHLAEYNDSWYYDMRRFLKGDGDMLNAALYHMRHIPEKAGCIHYLSNYAGFTLADSVSYDHKHNEENGEMNRDGSDFNCSWNCGEEGPSRRTGVKRLRLKQMKNAMCLLMLSQSSPLIFMGDEFGNSQKGNNNPYCQDNVVTWLDWRTADRNAELLNFWKMLVRFRGGHPILRQDREMRLTDYIACGYPDLSYHGQNAWNLRTDGCFRHAGIMLCGKYVRTVGDKEDSFLYIALNMHWEEHLLALPRLPKGLKWERAFSTESGREERKTTEEGSFRRNIPVRSIEVYVSVGHKE